MRQNPLKPTRALVLENVRKFNDQGKVTEATLKQLVNAFPANSRLEDVLLKAIVLNRIYSVNVYPIYEMADHIQSLDVDQFIKVGDPDIVGRIATPSVDGKVKRYYSFTSKYCALHNPEKYPIYDSLVDDLLWKYQTRDQFSNFSRAELQDYPKFQKIVQDFISHYELNGLTIRNIDNFLWVLAKGL